MRLEIHHINVSQGDATLVINRDLDALRVKVMNYKPRPPLLTDSQLLHFAIDKEIDLEGTVKCAALIDVAEGSYGYDISQYIRQYGVKGAATQANFYFVASHYHSDHIGGARDIFSKQGPNYKTDKTSIVPNYPPGRTYDTGASHLDPETGAYGYYLTEHLDTSKHKVDPRILSVGDSISLGKGVNNGTGDVEMKLFCIASDRNIYKRTEPLPVKSAGDQNARSLVLVLEYGPFRYFLGGDIGGTGKETGGNTGIYKEVPGKKMPGSGHDDIETSVREALVKAYPAAGKTPAGHVCAFKANHHGSSSSNDIYLLAVARPKVFLISSGTAESFHYHPTQEVINRIDSGHCAQWTGADLAVVPNSIENYYITEMSDYIAPIPESNNLKKELGFVRTFSAGKGRIIGDIIVRPRDEDILNKGAAGVRINVYGTGIQAASGAEQMKILPAVKSEPFAAIPDAAKGPWEHKCDLH